MDLFGRFGNAPRASRSGLRVEQPTYRWAGFFPGWAWHGFKWAGGVCCAVKRTLVLADAPHGSRTPTASMACSGRAEGAKQHFDYGLALQKEGQWERAEQQYKIALSYKPADAKSHMNLATVLMAQARYDAAVPHVEEALRLQPDNGEFHFNYASLLQRLGRGDEAGPQYEAAARLLPDSPEAHYGYALILASAGKGNDALRELQRTVQLRPDYVDAQLKLADALFAKGDLEEAKMHYTTALRRGSQVGSRSQ